MTEFTSKDLIELKQTFADNTVAMLAIRYDGTIGVFYSDDVRCSKNAIDAANILNLTSEIFEKYRPFT
jgi:hypothetical protein